MGECSINNNKELKQYVSRIAARYGKMHMSDIEMQEAVEVYTNTLADVKTLFDYIPKNKLEDVEAEHKMYRGF